MERGTTVHLTVYPKRYLILNFLDQNHMYFYRVYCYTNVLYMSFSCKPIKLFKFVFMRNLH